jgi:hypothetical protein
MRVRQFAFVFSSFLFLCSSYGQTRIDIMVLYTYDADTLLTNYGAPKDAEMEIQEALLYANQVFSNSQIDATLNLIHTQRVDYEVSDNDGETLSWMQAPQDSHMDSIHILRDEYAADIVLLLSTRGSIPGIGGFSQGNNTRWDSEAFVLLNIANDMEEMDDRTFIHEIGHVLGAMHDWYSGPNLGLFRDDESSPSIMYNKGYTYVDTTSDSGFYTIMSYANMGMSMGSEMTAIPYFSSPNILYNGIPIGKPEVVPSWNMDFACYNATTDILFANCPADNGQSINWMAPTIAAYRDSSGPDGTPQELHITQSSNLELDISWTENISNEDGFKIFRSIDEGWNFSVIDSVPANTTLYTSRVNDVVQAGQKWIFRVQAYNYAGSSTFLEDSIAINTEDSGFYLTEEFAGSFNPQIGWQNDTLNPWEFTPDPIQSDTAIQGPSGLDYGFGHADLSLEANFREGFVSFEINAQTLIQLNIDGNYLPHSAWSLTEDWDTLFVPIDSGQHTLTWEFLGGTHAFLDNIKLPIQENSVPLITFNPSGSIQIMDGKIFLQNIKPRSRIGIYNLNGQLLFNHTTQHSSEVLDFQSFNTQCVILEVKQGKNSIRRLLIKI